MTDAAAETETPAKAAPAAADDGKTEAERNQLEAADKVEVDEPGDTRGQAR